jgi:uncharacterized protein involved in exopolysaccharide biosynthesis
MEKIAILDVLRRYFWVIIGVSIAAAVAGYAVSIVLPKKYEATALVLVRPQQPIKLSTENSPKEFLDLPMSGTGAVETASKTYIEIIKSPTLIGQVVRELALEKKDLDTEESHLKTAIKTAVQALIYGKTIEDDPFAKAVKDVQSNLAMDAYLDTYTFVIKYTDKTPEHAATIANMTAKKFISMAEEMRISEAKSLSDHLRTQADEAREALRVARERLEGYKEQHSVFLYEPEYEAKLKVISELEVELAKAEALLVGSQSTLSAESLALRRERLIRSIRERQAELVPLPAIERELKQRETDVKAALSAYEIVDKEYKQADIKRSYAMPEVRLVSPAVVPHLPSSPIPMKIALISLLGGSVIGLALAFSLEGLNRRFRGIHDVEDFVGVKVLATIPRIPRRRWHHAGLL